MCGLIACFVSCGCAVSVGVISSAPVEHVGRDAGETHRSGIRLRPVKPRTGYLEKGWACLICDQVEAAFF